MRERSGGDERWHRIAAHALASLSPLLVTAGCLRGGEPQRLELLAFAQREVKSVALNEDLLFYFSGDLDRTSITSGSVRVVDERGADVPGKLLVRGNALSFQPELPRAPDLSDGGLQPGTLYRVVLGGFPRPDGIRSRSGALLSATMMLSFRTAERGKSPLFVDPFFGPSALVPIGEHRRAQEVVVSEGRIELECGEALDPSSIGAQGFALLRFPDGSGADDLEPVPVPIEVRLLVNRRDRALLVIKPVERPAFEHDDYYLSLTDLGPHTLGGRRVDAGWPGVLTVIVRAPRFELDFTAVQGGSSDAPPGCDGTAIWGKEGVTVRYPAAAGSGAAGPIDLAVPPSSADTQATRLSIPKGAEVSLDGVQGPVVLRSQGTLEVSGRLSRQGSAFHPGEALSVELHAALSKPPGQWSALGPWVQHLLAPDAQWAGEPWTVLVAGGDLVVPREGKIEVDGPLLLAAGGWIRVEGSVLARELWRTPEGGGNLAGRTTMQILPLVLDPPTLNSLREPLRIGLVTGKYTLPPSSGSWTKVLERKGQGDVHVDFLVQRRDGTVERGAGVLDPARQSGLESRLLIELFVPAGRGEPWDPLRLLRFALEPPPGEEEPPRPQ